MLIEFFKMHAQGNDYIYFDFRNKPEIKLDFPKISRKLSHRNFGIGSDGLVIISNDKEADAFMRIFNADGSEAEMCGSALRCLGYYLYNESANSKMVVNTLSGIKKIEVINSTNDRLIKVNIGKPFFIDDGKVNIQEIYGYTVDIGNPHFVSISNSLSINFVRNMGSKIEHDSNFPKRTNVDFVEILDRENISLKFWERGSGITLACGTGTLASFYTVLQLGLVENTITAHLPGGEIDVIYKNDEYFLAGPVKHVFKGFVEI